MHYRPHTKQTLPSIRSTHKIKKIYHVINTLLAIGTFLISGMSHAEKNQASGNKGNNFAESSYAQDAIDNLLSYALSYKGTPYRSGGTDPVTGFDCSGFVRYVFDHAEGIALPHNSSDISQIGKQVDLAELHPGDLVFFYLTSKTVSHVGIYLGNEQFIHAASNRSGSVVVSNLKENYWGKHFMTARRIETPIAKKQTYITLAHFSPTLHLDSQLHDFATN